MELEGKPAYLYHGSRTLTAVLVPRPARGVGPDKDRLCAVYASHVREFAIAFALPFVPTEDGSYAWRMDFDPNHIEVMVIAGRLDVTRKGYLYRVPSATFAPVDDLQWVSYDPVAPLDYRLIDPADYAHWITCAANL
jgi:hypothetical protein